MKVEVEMTPTQEKWINNRTRELLVEGSAGSGKTIFACYKVVFYALQHDDASIYIYRKTLPSLKRTAWKEIRDILYSMKIPYHENKSEGVIEFANNSRLFFGALDELSKVRSINADMIYIEQAEELLNTDFYNELMLRLGRGEASKKRGSYSQMLLVVQPESEEHWIYRRFHEFDDVAEKKDEFGKVIESYDKVLERKKKDRITAHFHYSENLKLPPESVQYYEDLKEQNYDLWLRYSAGMWGKLTDVVFPNYDIVEGNLPEMEMYSFGIDFGYNNPSCFLLLGWCDDECYVIDEVYGSKMLNDEFIRRCDEMLFKHEMLPSKLYCGWADSANPDKIEEFFQAGYNVEGSIKNVDRKISTTQQTAIHIHPRCVETIREIKGYSWKKDKEGRVLDEPVKFNDHAMDALAYGVYGIRGQLSPNKPIDSGKFYNQIRVY